MTQSAGQLGKYSLTRHLATGGMAEIWLAEQAGPGGFNKELVIKRILPHFAEDTTFATMFLDEARLAAQLSHPKIAQIYELGEVDGQYFIAMEYIQGIDLDVLLQKVMDREEVIPIEVVCKIVMDVLEALDYAHDYTDRDGQPYNLVHRDVSPHNVLVSNDGIVKLCDFGVAKAKANQTKTQPGAVKGKFAYMAPEQIQNADDLDRRADVFAAGIMFYELLTGTKPFGDELAAINAIITAPHPDINVARPDVPEALKRVIDRALEKRREDRYTDAHAMMRDIETFVRGLDEYVGDRELATYVRTVQGLPLTRQSVNAISAEDLAAEDGIGEPDPFEDTGPQVAPRKTNPEDAIPSPVATTGRISDGPTQPGVHATGPVEPKKSHTGLVILGGLVLLGIVAALAVIAINLPTAGVDKPPDTTQPTKPVVQGVTAHPSLLRIPGGILVTIRARPDADLYVNGKFVGSTPFAATLPAGSYKVEFRSKSGDKRKVETIKVDKNTSSFQSLLK